MDKLLKKYSELESRFLEIEKEMTSCTSNLEKYQELAKKYAELEAPIKTYHDYKNISEQYKENDSIINDKTADAELIQLAKEENTTLKEKQKELENTLRLLLLPRDPNDTHSCYLEIRAGTGGDEAAIFAGNLYDMYSRFCEKNKWRRSLIDINPSESGGFKEAIVFIEGNGAYGKLKYEAGIHRVQRVPVTESSGRIHTSAATVAIMPETTSSEIEIRNDDLRVDTYRSSGAGGQHINKTDSAVRITHIPSGIVVSCQDGRSQHQNKERAMNLLQSKLIEKQELEQSSKESSSRRVQVGSGDRSEKIRTYNYPQGRITDHRINFTSHNLQNFLDGNIDELIEALITANRLKQLAKL